MYRRITSYIYAYDNGEKQGSCGYFRLDIRDGQYKLSLNVKVPNRYTMGVAEVHLLKGSGAAIKGIQLGKTMGVNGNICFKHIWQEKADEEASYPVNIGLEDITGILIYNGDDFKRVFAGTIKEDEDIDILSFSKEYEENTVYEIDEECQEERCRRMREEAQADMEIPEQRGEETLEEARDNGAEEYTAVLEQDSADIYTEEKDNAAAENDAQNNTVEINAATGDSGVSEVVSMDIKENNNGGENWQELLFSKFPKVRVNFGGENSEAVKMRPHDLVWFPRRYWRFSNNRLLLDGYYNYRYIMLVRGKGKREGCYYLAVPGRLISGSGSGGRQAAAKNGFTEFVADKGDFGYWCCRVG